MYETPKLVELGTVEDLTRQDPIEIDISVILG